MAVLSIRSCRRATATTGCRSSAGTSIEIARSWVDIEGSPRLLKDLGVDDKLLRALTDAGDITKIGDFYLSASAAAKARATVRAHIEAHGPITVAQIRDLLGTTRKYAVPLCEWLDDTGATIRRADLRHLGPHP